MGSIHLLPTHLVNKIAAGEVIERPASIVKELVENALDAGATHIDVSVKAGGRDLIAVTDNGSGMSAEDLRLAFAPHATSKLTDEADLFDIHTMGFRGEALPSIASISQADIRTRRRDDDSGYQIAATGDTLEDIKPCAGAPGTTVTVRNLFFNTPARRKFMKSAQTEMGHVSEQVTRLALPHPHVAFTLTHNGRQTMNLPAVAATGARIHDIFGPQVAEGLMPIARETEGLQVAGLIGPPSASRGGSRWQYVFLNGRYIRDRLLTHALREAYRGLIDPNRWPVAFIFLQIDPDQVDVNVHPTKIEVRFADSQRVHSALLAALRDTLNKTSLERTAVVPGDQPLAPATDAAEEGPREESLRQALQDFLKSAPAPQPRLSFPQPQTRPAPTASTAVAEGAIRPSPPAMDAPAEPSRVPATTMQVHNSYLVAEEPDGMVIVDQHALHERILYNELKGRLAEAPLSSQRTLIPQTLPVTASEADVLAGAAELLKRLGIVIEPFGPTTVAVQQFPTVLIERRVDAAQFVRNALDALSEDPTADGERLLQALLQLMACKAAVKAGDPLSPAEIEDLLARGREVEKSSACPHGRPSMLKLTMADLAKQFDRT